MANRTIGTRPLRILRALRLPRRTACRVVDKGDALLDGDTRAPHAEGEDADETARLVADLVRTGETVAEAFTRAAARHGPGSIRSRYSRKSNRKKRLTEADTLP